MVASCCCCMRKLIMMDVVDTFSSSFTSVRLNFGPKGCRKDCSAHGRKWQLDKTSCWISFHENFYSHKRINLIDNQFALFKIFSPKRVIIWNDWYILLIGLLGELRVSCLLNPIWLIILFIFKSFYLHNRWMWRKFRITSETHKIDECIKQS